MYLSLLMIDAIEFCLINVVALNIDTAYNRGCCQRGVAQSG